MGRPRRTSDEELLEAARAVFLEQGPAAPTSLIAERAAVSHATLFQRFGTKEELLVKALMPRGTPDWIAQVSEGPDARPIAEQLRSHGAAILAFLEEMVPRVATLRAGGIEPFSLLPRGSPPPPVRARRALSGFFERAVAAGLVRPCNADGLAELFLGALHMHAFQCHLGGAPRTQAEQRAYLDTVIEVVLQGIAPRSSIP